MHRLIYGFYRNNCEEGFLPSVEMTRSGRNDSLESVHSYCHFEEAKRLRNLWIE